MQICAYPTSALISGLLIEDGGKGGTLTDAEIAGMVIGLSILLICCFSIAFVLWKRRKADKEVEEDEVPFCEMIKGAG